MIKLAANDIMLWTTYYNGHNRKGFIAKGVS